MAKQCITDIVIFRLELFVLNKESLIEQMDIFSKEFEKLREMIKNEDIETMKEKMRLSTKRRALFDKR